MPLTAHAAGRLLFDFGADISRFVNRYLSDAHWRGLTIYTADKIAAIGPDAEGFVAVGEFIDAWDGHTCSIKLHPATGELRAWF